MVGDTSVGQGGLEPTQLAVRSVIERAVVEVMANIYGMPDPSACMSSDPLGGSDSIGPAGSFTPAYNTLRTNNAQTRADPDRWNSAYDPSLSSRRRDRY
jgi:hypothetical protein